MDNYIGKCFKQEDQLIRIKNHIVGTNCCICSCLMRLENNLGYKSFPDIIFDVANMSHLVNPTINDKIYKLLKMNAVTCNSILKLAEKPNKSTKYTRCVFPADCYTLFHQIGYSEVMIKFSPECAYISTERPMSYEKFSLVSEEQILPRTYTKVRDIVVDTINQIDEIWTSI